MAVLKWFASFCIVHRVHQLRSLTRWNWSGLNIVVYMAAQMSSVLRRWEPRSSIPCVRQAKLLKCFRFWHAGQVEGSNTKDWYSLVWQKPSIYDEAPVKLLASRIKRVPTNLGFFHRRNLSIHLSPSSPHQSFAGPSPCEDARMRTSKYQETSALRGPSMN